MKKSLLSLLLMGIIWNSHAQFQKPDVSLPSPNAAALGKFGGIPVSYYTGLPQISLPLFSISDGQASVPVSLNYHGSGVRINEHPGWVGLNWNLSAGGAITRKVNDVPDENNGCPEGVICPGSPDASNNTGYYFGGKNIVNTSDWDTQNRVLNIAQSYGSTTLPNQNPDTEPDEFSFNFLGYSGKFYYNGLNFQVQCDEHIEVTLKGFADSPLQRPTAAYISYGRFSQTFSGFELKTENGTKYHFGGNTNSIEYSIPFFRQTSADWTANTWNLTKIETPDGNIIDFTYEAQNNEMINSMYISMFHEVTNVSSTGKIYNFIFFANANFFNTGCFSWPDLMPPMGFYGGTLIRPSYLKEINSRNAKVVFESDYTTELRYPESNNGHNVYKKFIDYYKATTGRSEYDALPYLWNGDSNPPPAATLIQRLKWRKLNRVKLISKGGGSPTVDEFEMVYNNNASQRLMLLSLKRVIGGTNNYNYTFDYYDHPTINLPDYLAQDDRTDHWGFHNDKGGNLQTLFENGNFSTYEANKEPTGNIDYLQEGTLRSIKFPTGGKTFFEYEPHACYKRISEDRRNLEDYSASIGGLRIKRVVDSPCDDVNNGRRVVREFFYNRNYSPGNQNGSGSSGILATRQKYRYTSFLRTTSANTTYQSEVFSSQNLLPSGTNANGSHIGYREVTEKFSDGGYRVFKFTNFESDDEENHMDEVPAVNLQGVTRQIYDPYTDRSFERGKLLEVGEYRSNGWVVAKQVMRYKRLSNDFVKSIYAQFFRACESGTYVYQGTPYKFYTYKYKLDYDEQQLFEPGTGSKVANRTNYQTYNSYGKVTQKQMPQSDGRYIVQRLKYVGDYSSTCYSEFVNCKNNCAATYQGRSDDYTNCVSGCQSTYQSCLQSADDNAKAILKMKSNGMIGFLVEANTLRQIDGQERTVAGTLNQYREFGGKHQLSKVLRMDISTPATNNMSVINGSNFTTDGPYNTSIPVVELTNYDSYGNPTQYTESSGIVTNLEWWDGADASKAGFIKSKNVGGLTTNYDYKQLVGVNNVRDPNNNGIKYEYDTLNRLIEVRNQQDNVLNKIQYNFGTSPCN